MGRGERAGRPHGRPRQCCTPCHGVRHAHATAGPACHTKASGTRALVPPGHCHVGFWLATVGSLLQGTTTDRFATSTLAMLPVHFRINCAAPFSVSNPQLLTISMHVCRNIFFTACSREVLGYHTICCKTSGSRNCGQPFGNDETQVAPETCVQLIGIRAAVCVQLNKSFRLVQGHLKPKCNETTCVINQHNTCG